MSSIPRGPNDDDAAGPPAPGSPLPRPSLDQTLVGVAPTIPPRAGVTPAGSSADEEAETEPPVTPDKSQPIVATPVIAVSGGGSEQKLEQSVVEPAGVAALPGLARADADPALQSTALASDYLQAARDAALRKVSVPRPRRPTPPPLEQPSAPTLRATDEWAAREPTRTAERSSPVEAVPHSIGTQTSVAPPLEAADGEPARSPSEPAANVERSGTPAVAVSAPAQPFARRFEPVPTVRAPLWEQAPPSVGRPLTLDSATPELEPLRAASPTHGASSGQRSRWYRMRWVALAAAVLAAVAFAVFGEQLARTPEGRVKLAETASKPVTHTEAREPAPPEQTTLANRPATEPATTAAVADLPANTRPVAAPASHEVAPVIAPANVLPGEPASEPVATASAKKKPVKRSKAKRKSTPAPTSEATPAAAK